jgi:hypothetical protein
MKLGKLSPRDKAPSFESVEMNHGTYNPTTNTTRPNSPSKSERVNKGTQRACSVQNGSPKTPSTPAFLFQRRRNLRSPLEQHSQLIRLGERLHQLDPPAPARRARHVLERPHGQRGREVVLGGAREAHDLVGAGCSGDVPAGRVTDSVDEGQVDGDEGV